MANDPSSDVRVQLRGTGNRPAIAARNSSLIMKQVTVATDAAQQPAIRFETSGQGNRSNHMWLALFECCVHTNGNGIEL
jgi:hypothetical protein